MAGEIIRELVTLLGFKVDEKTITEYERRVTGAKVALRKFAWAAAIAGGAVAGVASKTIRAGSELIDASKRLGLGVEALQEWRYAAEQAGVSAEVFSEGVKYFGKSAAESTMGIGRARVAFARLAEYGLGKLTGPGGKLRDLSELLPESLLALSKMENPIERNALAMKLFGETGMQVVQMLDRGIDSIEEARKKFNALGLGMKEKVAKAAERAGDAWHTLKESLAAVTYVIGGALLPVLESTFNWLSGWIAKYRDLAVVLGASALALAVFTAGVYALVVAKKLWLLVTLDLNVAMALLLLKIVAIGALIAAVFAVVYMVVEDLVYYFKDQGTETITGRLVAAAGRLKDRAWAAIKAFVAGIPGEVYAQIDKIKKYWTEKWNDFLDLVGGLASKLGEAVNGFIAALETAWDKTVAWMGQKLGAALAVVLPDFLRIPLEEMMRPAAGPPEAFRQLQFGNVALTFHIQSPPGTTPEIMAAAVATHVTGALDLDAGPLNFLGVR